MAASDIGFYILYSLRSSRPEVFCRKSVLRNFAKFTGKHLCQSFLFIKKETMEQLFSCEFCEISKRKDTLWNFSFRAFHEIQFQGYYMKHEILSWNTFTLVFQFHCVGFLSIKKLCLQLEMYRVKFNSIKKYLWLIKQKQNNSKIPKHIWMKPCSKTRGGKSACADILLETPLTI